MTLNSNRIGIIQVLEWKKFYILNDKHRYRSDWKMIFLNDFGLVYVPSGYDFEMLQIRAITLCERVTNGKYSHRLVRFLHRRLLSSNRSLHSFKFQLVDFDYPNRNDQNSESISKVHLTKHLTDTKTKTFISKATLKFSPSTANKPEKMKSEMGKFLPFRTSNIKNRVNNFKPFEKTKSKEENEFERLPHNYRNTELKSRNEANYSSLSDKPIIKSSVQLNAFNNLRYKSNFPKAGKNSRTIKNSTVNNIMKINSNLNSTTYVNQPNSDYIFPRQSIIYRKSLPSKSEFFKPTNEINSSIPNVKVKNRLNQFKSDQNQIEFDGFKNNYVNIVEKRQESIESTRDLLNPNTMRKSQKMKPPSTNYSKTTMKKYQAKTLTTKKDEKSTYLVRKYKLKFSKIKRPYKSKINNKVNSHNTQIEKININRFREKKLHAEKRNSTEVNTKKRKFNLKTYNKISKQRTDLLNNKSKIEYKLIQGNNKVSSKKFNKLLKTEKNKFDAKKLIKKRILNKTPTNESKPFEKKITKINSHSTTKTVKKTNPVKFTPNTNQITNAEDLNSERQIQTTNSSIKTSISYPIKAPEKSFISNSNSIVNLEIKSDSILKLNESTNSLFNRRNDSNNLNLNEISFANNNLINSNVQKLAENELKNQNSDGSPKEDDQLNKFKSNIDKFLPTYKSNFKNFLPSLNITRAFTFSYFKLPVQHLQYNANIKRLNDNFEIIQKIVCKPGNGKKIDLQNLQDKYAQNKNLLDDQLDKIFDKLQVNKNKKRIELNFTELTALKFHADSMLKPFKNKIL